MIGWYLVGIFGVDVVFDGVAACFVEVFGSDLDQVLDFCLYCISMML